MRPPLRALAFLSLVPAIAAAQFPERVQTGVRVRVWIPEPYMQRNGPWKRQLLRGTVSAVENDLLHVTIPGADGTLAIPRASIRRLEVSRGAPSRAISAFERAVTLGLFSALWTAIYNDPDDDDWRSYDTDWRAAGHGAIVGAASGAVIGFLIPTERWRRVRLSR